MANTESITSTQQSKQDIIPIYFTEMTLNLTLSKNKRIIYVPRGATEGSMISVQQCMYCVYSDEAIVVDIWSDGDEAMKRLWWSDGDEAIVMER